MKLAAYKTETLARADVDDIVGVEVVEKRPVKDEVTGQVTGYEQVVQTTETGKTIAKYDVHLMRVVDGVKKFDKEHIAVVNEGKTDEEVVYTAPTTKPEAITETVIEAYVKALPFKDIQITRIDVDAPSALFTGIKVANGAGVRVEVLAYKEAGKPPTYVEVTN